MHFKETLPLETVKKLKSIFNRHGIEIEEHWKDVSSIGTYSLRITIKGTNVGSNGKGVSKEFALASAYAELMERFQNECVAPANQKIDNSAPYRANYHKIMSSYELAESNNSFMNFYFHERNLQNHSISEKAKIFKKVQRLDFLLTGEEDSYITVPFYSLKHKKIEYLPKNIYNYYYGSNGMCSGNSPEEALVQGLSEIFERVVQKKIFFEHPSFPNIPDEYIKKFPYVYDMFSKLKSYNGYKCALKDCSMGGKYPVAALIIIEKNTGNYGIKLGCHPDLGIAMERTLTEASQGQDIFEYTKRIQIDFTNSKVTDKFNIQNSYKIGMAEYPYQIFDNSNTYPFVPIKDVSSMNNKEILLEWAKGILKDGYDILIRDVSNLGFPSYHIIIPGLSEVFFASDKKFTIYNTRTYVSSLLSNPKQINKENTKYIIGIMEYFKGSLLEDNIKTYYPISENLKLPCDDIFCGCDYMIAMCHILNGNYIEAAKKMKIIIFFAKKHNVKKEELYLYKGMYHYLSAMSQLNSHDKVMEYMETFFDDSIYKQLDNLFKNPENIIVKQYPSCYEKESNNLFVKCITKLKNVQAKNPIDQKNIESLFKL
jgi:ribosomal protein S12 methylthiotransferase accessory factor